jgi:hypothetical protein
MVAYVDGDMASWIESVYLLYKAMLPLPSDVAQKIFGGATYATYIQLGIRKQRHTLLRN